VITMCYDDVELPNIHPTGESCGCQRAVPPLKKMAVAMDVIMIMDDLSDYPQLEKQRMPTCSDSRRDSDCDGVTMRKINARIPLNSRPWNASRVLR